MRALWLVNQLWVIVTLNPRKNRASSELYSWMRIETKKRKSVSREMYTFPEVKLGRLNRKTYEDK